MSWPSSDTTLGPFFSTEAMAHVFSDERRIQAMLDVEVALARAQAGDGIIPYEAATVIAETAETSAFDPAALGQSVCDTGNLAIPFVKVLTAAVAARDQDAARWVHWGATSQDIIDTGLVLQMQEGLALIIADLDRLGDRLAELAETHAETPAIARSLMQQAIPTTLGLRMAGWLSAIMRGRQSLLDCRDRCLALQFGGAGGNLASLSPDGRELSRRLAQELGLILPDLPWHTQRDRIAEMGNALAVLLGTLGKMGRDLALMAQTEVGEFREPSGAGRGGSSAMPHKANPVACARMIAAAKRAPGLAATLLSAMEQEQERSLGVWQAEWEVMPQLFRLTAAALEAATVAVEAGDFDTARMRQNLELTSGLVMAEAVSIALGRKTGKAAAHQLVARAARNAAETGRHLRACLEEDAEISGHLGGAELDTLFKTENHLGAAPEFARYAAESWRQAKVSPHDLPPA